MEGRGRKSDAKKGLLEPTTVEGSPLEVENRVTTRRNSVKRDGRKRVD